MPDTAGIPNQNTSKNDVVPLGISQKKYSQFLAKMTEIGEEDIITRPNCKFCLHPARKEAEEKWERSGGSYASVERFFADYKKDHPDAPLMNYINIRGHIDHHYKQQIKRLRIREYADHLKDVMQERIDQIEMLEALCSSLQIKYMDLASDESIESTRQTDAMVKVAKILVDIAKFKAELVGDLKPINVFAEKVLNVWTTAIQTESNDAVKRRLLEVLNNLEREVGSIGT